jgi:hypothetical protein
VEAELFMGAEILAISSKDDDAEARISSALQRLFSSCRSMRKPGHFRDTMQRLDD